MVVGRRWQPALGEGARTADTSSMRESAVGSGNLSAKERKELRRLAGKLDLEGHRAASWRCSHGCAGAAGASAA